MTVTFPGTFLGTFLGVFVGFLHSTPGDRQCKGDGTCRGIAGRYGG
jgi:hypothetical protein